MRATGARSSGSDGSTGPVRTTVTRRSVSVSCASGVTWPPDASSTLLPGSIVRASASVVMSKRLAPIEHRDMGEVPVLLGVIESVADDEPILNRKPDVLDDDIHQPARRFAEQAGRPQGLW